MNIERNRFFAEYFKRFGMSIARDDVNLKILEDNYHFKCVIIITNNKK